jgi:branched-chain amino acid transport system permease protein
MSDQIVQLISSTLIQGSLLAVISMGMTLVYGALRVLNMAQGVLVMIGGFVAYIVTTSLNASPWLGLLAALVVTFIAGVLTYYLSVKPLIGRRGVDFEMTAFISTFALATIMQNLILIMFGPRQKTFPPLLEGSLNLTDSVSISFHQVLIGVVGAISLALLGIFLSHSRYGLAITAISQNLDAARLMGIPVGRAYIITMGLAGSLAGLAGVLLGPIYFVSPNAGDLPLLQALIIVIFAGLGSVKGTLYAAYIIGFVSSAVGICISSTYSLTVLYAVIVGLLIFRPNGISGRPQEVRL